MQLPNLPAIRACHPAWNKGRIVGQKRPLLPKHVWAIRVRLEISDKHRDLALFNLAIDSKLRGCDLVCLKVADVLAAGHVKERASIIQSKTQKPVQFEITEGTRKPLLRWIGKPLMTGSERGGSARACTSRHANMRGWLVNGSTPLGLSQALMARILCAEPRLRRSTRRPAIYVRFNSCLATQKWTAQSVTSVLN